MDRKFGDIEIFLATFPEDPKIIKSAVELVATTLLAIENTIGFFLSNDCEYISHRQITRIRSEPFDLLMPP